MLKGSLIFQLIKISGKPTYFSNMKYYIKNLL